MDNRTIGLFAVGIGAIGTVLRIGGTVIRGQMNPDQIPGWFVFGTTGSSIVAYTSIIEILVPILTILLSIFMGFYAERKYSLNDHFSFIWTVSIGSVAGIISISALSQVLILSVDGTSIMIPVLLVIQHLAQVAPIVVLGMYAGASISNNKSQV